MWKNKFRKSCQGAEQGEQNQEGVTRTMVSPTGQHTCLAAATARYFSSSQRYPSGLGGTDYPSGLGNHTLAPAVLTLACLSFFL
jgi:hypothetical protein